MTKLLRKIKGLEYLEEAGISPGNYLQELILSTLGLACGNGDSDFKGFPNFGSCGVAAYFGASENGSGIFSKLSSEDASLPLA